MTIQILAFGIAKDIIQSRQLRLEMPEGADLGLLRGELCRRYPEFQKLRSLSFAVNEAYQPESLSLKDGDEVVIIPPVSGG